MSTEIEGKCGTPSSCASCGVAEGDAIKLKKCAACCLVKYCSVECQRGHRPTHKRACKQRAAELHDEILFRQPESNHFGDCPICYLPLSTDEGKSIMMKCCSKIICEGCSYACEKREIEQNMYPTCPFCRQPDPESQAEAGKWQADRAARNDPVALREEGYLALESGNYQSAFKYWSKAVELGDVTSHYEIALLYHHGRGVEMDESKAVHHYEQAAIGGHAAARYNLSVVEWRNFRIDRAVKHRIIAAKLGNDTALESLKDMYKAGFPFLSKDDFAAALRGHQAAVDGTKSPQREAAEAVRIERAVLSGRPSASYNLACIELNAGRLERAVKHLIIAAKLGHDPSLERLKKEYKRGIVDEIDFGTAFRGHQAAVAALQRVRKERQQKSM